MVAAFTTTTTVTRKVTKSVIWKPKTLGTHNYIDESILNLNEYNNLKNELAIDFTILDMYCKKNVYTIVNNDSPGVQCKLYPRITSRVEMCMRTDSDGLINIRRRIIF